MRPFQAWARKNRVHFFTPFIHGGDHVLEIGPGEGWFRSAVDSVMNVDYVTLDIDAAADIHGDIRRWRELGLEAASFDVIVAFEVVEHIDCFQESYDLLKPGGLMLITTPMPHADWLLKLLEHLHLTQKRTSAHSNLVYLRDIRGFSPGKVRSPFGIGQWAVFRKVEE